MDQIAALFSNNLINCFILSIFLIYMWARLTPPMFEARKKRIESALDEAEKARNEGQEFYRAQEERLANAEAESRLIIEDAGKLAEKMKAEIEAQILSETNALRDRIRAQIDAECQQAVMEMRRRSALVAVGLAEASLSSEISDGARTRLLVEFIQQLDNGGLN